MQTQRVRSGDPEERVDGTPFEIPPSCNKWQIEFDVIANEGAEYVIGVDEAGRGALAGPIVAAAVVLRGPSGLAEIEDSKRLTPAARERLRSVIEEHAFAWAVAFATAREIDRRGIEWANRIVFTRAIRELQRAHPHLKGAAAHVLVDGNRRALRCPYPQTTVTRGDQRSLSIAAASILAKTARDRYCSEHLHSRYPQYGFDRHKGYGTLAHRRALSAWGTSPEHRTSFAWHLAPQEEKQEPRR